MYIRVMIAALAVVLTGVGKTTYAEMASKAKHLPLAVVIDSADFYPYYYRVDGKLVGPLPEVTIAVLSAIGYTVDYQETPWARAVDLVKRQKVDAITGIFYRQEREAFLHYPQHFPAESKLNLIVPSNSELKLDGNPLALEGHDIGAVHGWSYGLLNDSPEIGRIDFSTEEILVRNVALGRIDIAIGNPTSLLKFAKDLGVENRIRIIDPPAESTPLYTAFTKKPGHKDLAQQFSAALAKFKQTPEFREIMNRHGIN